LLKEAADKDPKKTIFFGWPKGVAFSNMTLEKATTFIEESAKAKEEKQRLAAENSSISSGEGGTGLIATIGKFVFKNGPYGPYMYNSSLKTKVFVPAKNIDPTKMTEAEAAEFYKAGVEKKKTAKKFIPPKKKE
jgi:topoisomerase IA-like protein